MRPPVPVVVDAPSPVSELKLPDSTFVIWIGHGKPQVLYVEDTITLSSLRQLDSLVGVCGGKSLNARVALRADRNDREEMDSVIAMLKRNGILRFSLITDLEK